MSIEVGDLVEIGVWEFTAGGQMLGVRGVVAVKEEQNHPPPQAPYRCSLRMRDGSTLPSMYEEPKLILKKKYGDFSEDEVDANPFKYHGKKDEMDTDQETLRELGYCPTCQKIPQMGEEGPFSHCMCGTAEDYADRPLQRIQLMEREIVELRRRLEDIRKHGYYGTYDPIECAEMADEALKLKWGRP